MSERKWSMVRQIVCVAILMLAVGMVQCFPCIANSQEPYTPPTEITVTMYHLSEEGAIPKDAKGRKIYTRCTPPNDIEFGCTAKTTDEYPYPYNTNPVTIDIERDYLLDVVPGELNPREFHRTAVAAQAVLARTYAYWHIHNPTKTIDNSTDFQVFVPHRFELAGRTSEDDPNVPDNPDDPCHSSNLDRYQQIVCNAVEDHRYISCQNNIAPAHTEFFADIPNRTNDGGTDCLRAVDDPISSHPKIEQDGHGRGLSQKGASRWVRGNLSGYVEKDAGRWSVQWDHPEQLLVHYYTGIHLREATTLEDTIPARRWNILDLRLDTPTGQYIPPFLVERSDFPMEITIQFQNTSTGDWDCQGRTYSLRYWWVKYGFTDYLSRNAVSVCGLSKGDPSTEVSFSINDLPEWGAGTYHIRFDIYEEILVTPPRGEWFEDGGWYPQNVELCIDCFSAYLPLLMKEASPSTPSGP
ncbi:MAG: SpoIID/LytB domain-containing protein [Chloroflexaceae bacterium]|nr:SpoIID/LytB domain-containing protein [Chloroflexaceae bacterium]